MYRTLYLNEKPGLKVVSDGPSLWITEKGRAGRRVPVRAIGRAVVRGRVDLDAGVLTLLSENGVPVCLISRSGVISAVLPFVFERFALRESIERRLYSEKGSAGVENFFRSTRKTVQRSVLKDLFPDLSEKIDERGLKENQYRKSIESILPCAATDKINIVKAQIDGIFFEFALKILLDAELPPHTGFLHRNENFGLVKDFLYAIEAERDRYLVQFFESLSFEMNLFSSRGSVAVNGAGMRAIALRFETHRKRLQPVTEKLLDGFFDILRESAE